MARFWLRRRRKFTPGLSRPGIPAGKLSLSPKADKKFPPTWSPDYESLPGLFDGDPERIQSNQNRAFIQQPEAAFAFANAFGLTDEFSLIGFSL